MREILRLLIVDVVIDSGLPVHGRVAEFLLDDGVWPVNYVDGVDVLGWEVLAGALITVDGKVTIAIEICHAGEGAVHGDVLSVDTDAVTGSIVVSEESGL